MSNALVRSRDGALRRKMSARGFSVRTLEAASGVPRSTIQYQIRKPGAARIHIDLAKAQKICDALECDVNEVFCWPDGSWIGGAA